MMTSSLTPPIEMPSADDLSDLECEYNTGDGTHTIIHVEMTTECSYHVDPKTGEISHLFQEWIPISWNCSCGHTTRF